MSADLDDNKPFDLFELCAAILLGLGAIGAALSGFEANQWGSKQMEAYGDANRFTTKASTQYSEDMVLLNADYAAIAQAKAQIIEAREAGDASTRDKHFEIASFIYTTQLSTNAYKAMGLPLENFVEDEGDTATAVPTPAAATPAPATTPAPDAESALDAESEDAEDAPSTSAEAATPAIDRDIPNAALLASLNEELDEDYVDGMLIAGENMFKQADERFDEGNKSDNIGDMFDLAGIAFTMALFFGGLCLVFKTKVRWILWGAGAGLTAVTYIFMLFQSWTM